MRVKGVISPPLPLPPPPLLPNRMTPGWGRDVHGQAWVAR